MVTRDEAYATAPEPVRHAARGIADVTRFSPFGTRWRQVRDEAAKRILECMRAANEAHHIESQKEAK